MDFEVISGKNKPKVQVDVVEKVKGMDWYSDRDKYLRKLALDLDILHLHKDINKTNVLNPECGSDIFCCFGLH